MNKELLEKIAPCLSIGSKGIVFNIQQFTVHDGPGIRTEIFLKGCHLRCKWCSNPESFELRRQVGAYGNSCIGISKCGKCLSECSKEALIVENDKVVSIDRSKCNDCMQCSKVCPCSALKEWGKEMDVEEVMKIIRQDQSFYDKSGGGVTISGGESLFQWQFTKEILKQCKKEGIHTCVESALHVKSEVLEKILPYTDMLITDIKHMNSYVHKQYTQTGNELILKNIQFVVEQGIPVIIRIPIIPNVNNSKEHIELVRDFILNQLNNQVKQVQFLRFRQLGEEKYQSLGIPYLMSEVNPQREQFESDIKELVKIMSDAQIPAYAGTTHKINLN